MDKKLLDILVCPFDKVTALDSLEFKTKDSIQVDNIKIQQELAKKKDNVSDSSKAQSTQENSLNTENDAAESQSSIVEEGLLLCNACHRFYPIIEEIPIILPDDLRDKKKDIDFLSKWRKSIPEDLFINLKPWTQ